MLINCFTVFWGKTKANPPLWKCGEGNQLTLKVSSNPNDSAPMEFPYGKGKNSSGTAVLPAAEYFTSKPL